ncbi:MAG: Protein kinase C signaling pathway involved MAPKK protein [Pleopsidium flavum]|nr:MAG: Protein kinase C signaling pathway involved MAPKK protein [Pleopsidium flavum]
MSSPAPLLRPPMLGGNRTNSGVRVPRLGLAIPPSPGMKPVSGNTNGKIPELPQLQRPASRPAPPQLRLATPSGSNATPQEGGALQNGRPPPQPYGGSSASGASDASGHSRSGSFTMLDGKVSGPTSASSSNYSALSFAMGLRQPQGTPDPSSAISSVYSERAPGEAGTAMERDGSMNGLPDLDKLSLEKGRNLDVEDLDDDGWRAASVEKKIVELGSLGEGAGGAVTRCMLKGGKTVFALKIITTDPNPDVKKQIVRELNFNKDCASEHICRYYGAFVDHSTGTISIAMEFCEGGSLDSVYREVKKLGGRTGEKVLGKVAEGVLNGLTYLHGQKIIHRDIKPSNILLCRNGQVKLCDFGVSGEFGTKGDANTFIGTSYYMAPERITGQSYTITSDVWSLGVTLLEVAQHRFPFPADGTEMQPRAGLIDLLTYIVRQPIPKLKDEPEHKIKWSENFKYFIECCLEKEPPRRATPWRMLEHPWMVEMKSKKVNMEHFLKQVWDWKD